MGALASKQYEFEGAQVIAMKAIATAKALEDSESMDMMTVQCYNTLGHAAVGLGAPEIGYNNHIDALSLARKMGQPLLAAESTRGLGLALLALQQHDDALSVMTDAYTMYKQMHPNNAISPILVRAEIEYAEALRNAKKYTQALKHAKDAYENREYLNSQDPVEATIYSVLASTIFATQGDLTECIALADAAIGLSEKSVAVEGVSQTIVDVHTLRKLNSMALKASFLSASSGVDAAVACQEEVVAGFKVLVGAEHAQTQTMARVLKLLKTPPADRVDGTNPEANHSATAEPSSEEVVGTDTASSSSSNGSATGSSGKASDAGAGASAKSAPTSGSAAAGAGRDGAAAGAPKKGKGKKRGRRASVKIRKPLAAENLLEDTERLIAAPPPPTSKWRRSNPSAASRCTVACALYFC